MKNIVEEKTLVVFILDESGSMNSVRLEAVDGFNEYTETLKGDDLPTTMSLITFNTRGLKVVIDTIDIQEIPMMTAYEFRPTGGTPLLDAIGISILQTDEFLEATQDEYNVMFTIMTDGHENSSRNFSAEAIKDLINEREDLGWIFTYLGANQNAWAEGRRMGIKSKYASNYQYGDPKEAMRVMAESTMRAKSNWRKMRKSADFYTDDEITRLSRIKKNSPKQ